MFEHRTVKLGLALTLVLLLAGATGVVALYVRDEVKEPATLRDEYPYLQSSFASGGGLDLHLTSVAFSGTSTLARVSIDASGLREEGSEIIVAAVIPREAVRGGDLSAVAPSVGGAIGSDGKSAVSLRLAPVSDARTKSVVISAVTVYDRDGGARAVEGPWTLTVTPPEDVARLLPVESVTAAGPTTASGITLSVASAWRSATEVLLTVDITSAGRAVPLDAPILRGPEGDVYGAEVDRSADGKRASYMFPPLRDGGATELVFSSFALAAAEGSASTVAFDASRVIADSGLAGKSGERGIIGPGATRLVSGSFAPIAMGFVDDGGLSLVVELAGALEPEAERPPVLTLPAGNAVEATTWEIGFHRDAAGTIVGSTTTIRFPIGGLGDIKGTVAVAIGGSSQVVSGPWTIKLLP